MSIDLLDHEVGGLCNLCGDQGGHAEASMRHADVGPVCSACFQEMVQSDRRLRDLLDRNGVLA